MVYQKIIEYCEERKLSIHAFEKLCELANGVVDDWKDGKTNPSLNSLMKIAEHTGLPVHYWIT